MFDSFVSLLSGVVTPALLFGCGALFSARLRFFWTLHPIRTARTLLSSKGDKKHSSARALTVALAGTLGVGNVAGVATAITAGGAGAVFWMLVSAFLAMGVKYAEVALAVAHRRRERVTEDDPTATDGDASRALEKQRRFYGGAMYYIRDAVCPAAGGVFAVLCAANAAITGNVIQTNAAASVFGEHIPPAAVGVAFALLTLAVTLGSAKRVSDVTVRLIPALAAVYIALCVWIVAANIASLPAVFSRVVGEAFSLRPALGAAGGVAVARAIRYGVTRGILSNEAGSGTSPTAHAAAETDDPHRQGVFGIFEVFADTVVLCTLTAAVILLAPDGGEDGVRLAVYAFGELAGAWAGTFIRVSVVLFAFATVICQAYYGEVALGYFTRSERARRAYIAVYSALCVVGSVIDPGRMWLAADLVISLMTALNVAALLWAFANRRMRSDLLPYAYTRRRGTPRHPARDRDKL